MSDNSSSFDKEVLDKFLAMVKVNHVYSSAYRSTTNGRAEILKFQLLKSIKTLSVNDTRNWDANLPAVLYAHGTKSNSVLGISPYEFPFGLSPRYLRNDPLQELGRVLGFERLCNEL